MLALRFPKYQSYSPPARPLPEFGRGLCATLCDRLSVLAIAVWGYACLEATASAFTCMTGCLPSNVRARAVAVGFLVTEISAAVASRNGFDVGAPSRKAPMNADP
jgi:hypothetical protein